MVNITSTFAVNCLYMTITTMRPICKKLLALPSSVQKGAVFNFSATSVTTVTYVTSGSFVKKVCAMLFRRRRLKAVSQQRVLHRTSSAASRFERPLAAIIPQI